MELLAFRIVGCLIELPMEGRDGVLLIMIFCSLSEIQTRLMSKAAWIFSGDSPYRR